MAYRSILNPGGSFTFCRLFLSASAFGPVCGTVSSVSGVPVVRKLSSFCILSCAAATAEKPVQAIVNALTSKRCDAFIFPSRIVDFFYVAFLWCFFVCFLFFLRLLVCFLFLCLF